ncbi:MAG: hypothetical protein WBD31_23225, partial [Rubripirellula sp.]
PLGATAEFMIQDHPESCRWRILGGSGKMAKEKSDRKIEFGKQYVLKHRVESTSATTTTYRVKIWEDDQSEPKEWNVVAEEEQDVANGGALLLAHYADVTFGNVTVTSCRETESTSTDGLPSLSASDQQDGSTDSEEHRALAPKPGDVYREYAIHNGGNFDWRVTDPRARHEGAKDFLPNPVLSLDVRDLEGAVRAEAVLDRWGGHANTKEKLIRFNEHDWITLPELKTTPEGYDPEQYHSQDNPVIPVPLDHLVKGTNTIEGTIGPSNEVSWGQWGLYSLILRVYYDPEKKQGFADGKIVSPLAGETFGENPTIALECDDSAERIDVLAWYDGYDEDGNGVYNEWHGSRFQPSRGHAAGLRDHVGTIDPSTTVRQLVWNTQWVPDQQPESMKLVARIHHGNGLIHVTEAVERLTLRREGWSVKQYRATDVPEVFSVRVGKSKSCNIPIDANVALDSATEAVLHYRTWEADDRHHKPFQLNGHQHKNHGNNHHYDYDLLPIPVSELQTGDNTFTISSDTKHHMLEVLWPGPAISIRYRRPKPNK